MNHQNVHRLTLPDKEIILIGTAHVSHESVELVEKIIAEEKPDVVCVELCQARLDAIQQKSKWHETDIVKVIRNNQASLLLSQLLMSSFQRRIAQRIKITPGEEMIRAMNKAEEVNAEVVLADREIRVTLLRTWRRMRLWSKIKFISEMFLSLFMTEDISEEDIEKLKEHDMLEMALETIGKKLPEVKATLIDERDEFLAHRIRNVSGKKVVAVVGAGHVPGIMNNLDREISIDEINGIPPAGKWARYFGWVFSALIVGLFVFGFFYSGRQTGVNMVFSWSVITAVCASIGAIVLLSHPLTIIASALSAPLATLHPLIATGWVAGLTEATFRKPQVKDFLALTNDITSIRGFFRNKITRVLLLIAVVNLTTSIGTFLAIPVMVRLLSY
ncbi:MAG: TraB/GumN family protein [Deltaproteobacteria bacterium]|nr:TraB/GumN family protein [Deltaproteobacteria bacterium]